MQKEAVYGSKANKAGRKTAFDKIQTIAFMFKRDFSKEENEGGTPGSSSSL